MSSDGLYYVLGYPATVTTNTSSSGVLMSTNDGLPAQYGALCYRSFLPAVGGS